MLRVFANRDFALYWLGSTVSLLGDGVYFVAIAWLVYDLSNTPSALAYVGVAWTLPQLASLLFAGAISDRFDRRRVMMIANAVSGLAIGVIAVLTIAGQVALWQLWILVAVHGVGVALFIPASGAFVPQLVAADQLVQANAVRQFVRPLTMRLVGPALGGVLVAVLGAGEAFLFDALSFFFAFVAVGLIRPRPRASARPESASIKGEIAAGLGSSSRRAGSGSLLSPRPPGCSSMSVRSRSCSPFSSRTRSAPTPRDSDLCSLQAGSAQWYSPTPSRGWGSRAARSFSCTRSGLVRCSRLQRSRSRARCGQLCFPASSYSDS